jgi:hypothetical protein
MMTILAGWRIEIILHEQRKALIVLTRKQCFEALTSAKPSGG